MASSSSPLSHNRHIYNSNNNNNNANHHSSRQSQYGNQIFIRSYEDDENDNFVPSRHDSAESPRKTTGSYRRSTHLSSPGHNNQNSYHHHSANVTSSSAGLGTRNNVRQSMPPPEFSSNYDHLRRKSYNPFDRSSGPNSQQPSPNFQTSSITHSSPQASQYLSHQTSVARHQSVSRLSPKLVSSGGTASSSTVTSASTAAMSANTQMTEQPAHSMKVVVVGDGGCGKTCLLISYSERNFPEKYVPTVFENYITQTPHPDSQKLVELALWDTAGQEEYDRLRPLSYPETDLVIICFAVDCPNSLDNVQDKPIMLIGLKIDRREARDCIGMLQSQGLEPVSPERGKEVADSIGATYMECSSKFMQNVDEVFDTAIRIAINGSESQTDKPDHHHPAIKAGKRKRPCRIL